VQAENTDHIDTLLGSSTRRPRLLSAGIIAAIAALLIPAWASAQTEQKDPNQNPGKADAKSAIAPAQNLGKVGAKLSNPVADLWALFTEFDVSFYDGNSQQGDEPVGSAMLFQPVMPFPLTDDLRLITRPTIPIVWSQPRPDGFDKTNRDSGIGDITVPLLIAPQMDNWIFAIGPTLNMPTSTNDALGRQQWALGPALGVGYKTDAWILGAFPQYFWKIGSRGDKNNEVKDASYMSFLWWGYLNLPNAWQVGTNPTITYDHQAESGNRWNVPIGITVAKTVSIGGRPVKFQVGAEYSVVSQDDWGKRMNFKLNIIPVIPGLLKKPIFGGR